MSRYRLYPSPEQEAVLLGHCAHARYVWNLAWISKDSRDSQAGFCCVACGFTCNADINASINIAAGHAGGTPLGVREPQLLAFLRDGMRLESPALQTGEDVN